MTVSTNVERAATSLDLYLGLVSSTGLSEIPGSAEPTLKADIETLRHAGTPGLELLHDFATRYGDKFGVSVARTLFREVDEIAAETLAQFAESGNAVPVPVSGTLKKEDALQADYGSLKIVDGFPQGFAESTMADSLAVLGGPTAIVLDYGKPTTRVYSVLIHASEPSGLAAALSYARNPEQDPQANIVFIVHNVRAAALGKFAERFLPADQLDLNRQWKDVASNPQSAHPYVREVHSFLKSLGPINFITDFHNNSGDNPLYSVFSKAPSVLDTALTQNDFLSENLAMLLTDRYMGVPLAGGFDGGVRDLAPSITIECGKRMTARADRAAEMLVRRLATVPVNFVYERGPEKPRYEMTAVLGLARPDMPMGFMGMPGAEEALRAGAFLLRPDMERLNFNPFRAGTVLGQYRGEGMPVQAVDYVDQKTDISAQWYVRDGELVRLKKSACFAMGSTHKPTIDKFDGFFTQTARVAPGRFFKLQALSGLSR